MSLEQQIKLAELLPPKAKCVDDPPKTANKTISFMSLQLGAERNLSQSTLILLFWAVEWRDRAGSPLVPPLTIFFIII